MGSPSIESALPDFLLASVLFAYSAIHQPPCWWRAPWRALLPALQPPPRSPTGCRGRTASLTFERLSFPVRSELRISAWRLRHSIPNKGEAACVHVRRANARSCCQSGEPRQRCDSALIHGRCSSVQINLGNE